MKNDLQSDLSEVEKQMSNTMIQHKELEKKLQTGLKSLENLEHKQTDLSTKFVHMERGIRTDMKAIENQQSEVSNKLKKQENELNRLMISNGRAGKYFFYRLIDFDKFLELRKDDNSTVFTVKGIRSF